MLWYVAGYLIFLVGGADVEVCTDPSLPGCSSRGPGLLQRSRDSTKASKEEVGHVSFSQFQSQVKQSFEAGKRRKRSQHALLVVEQDLITKYSSMDRAYDPTKSCADNANVSFDDFAVKSGLRQELSADELQEYKGRVEGEILLLCKHLKVDATDPSGFHNIFGMCLNDQKPLLTQRMVNLLQDSGISYNLSVPDWLVKLGHIDMKHLAGKVMDQDHESLLMQTEVITSRMKTRALPAAFDSRTAWPQCESVIGRIHDQGQCGSCWAFGALSSIDSRICIATDGGFTGRLSRGFVTSCAKNAGEDGCAGGTFTQAFKLLSARGVPTGGSGCSPYFGHGSGLGHFQQSSQSPPCPTQCGNQDYARTLEEDIFKIRDLETGHDVLWAYGATDPALVYQRAREAIMTEGPIPAGMFASGSFMGYMSGVYEHPCDKLPNHGTTAIGWGKANGNEYWTVLNSWGDSWGESGSFRINLCGLTDFAIPTVGLKSTGTNHSFPLPLPTTTTTTERPTTSASQSPPPARTKKGPWELEGPCAIDEKGCIMSPNFDGDSGAYGNDQTCKFTLERPVQLEVVDFNTEMAFDELTIDGTAFSGSDGSAIQGLTAIQSLTWTSDGDVTNTGWKLCQASNSTTSSSAGEPRDTSRMGYDVIKAGDTIYLRAHTGTLLDANNGTVGCQSSNHGDLQMFRIEKKIGGGIHQHDTIYLRTHEDKHVGNRGSVVTGDFPTESASSLVQSGSHWDAGFGGGDGYDGYGGGDGFDDGQGDGCTGWDFLFNPGCGETDGDTPPTPPYGIQVAFHVEKEESGTDVIYVNDKIYLRTSNLNFLEVQGTSVQASATAYTASAQFAIEREARPVPSPPSPSPAPEEDVIMAGETIFFRAYSGKHLASVKQPCLAMPWSLRDCNLQCLFDHQGELQSFRLMKMGGGPISAGDKVYLKGYRHYHVAVEGIFPNEGPLYGSWKPNMEFTIEKNSSDTGHVRVNDAVYLKAHTGKYLDVYEHWCPFISPKVRVRYSTRGEMQKFIIERKTA